MKLSVDLQVACPVDSVPPESELSSWLAQAYLVGGGNTKRQCEVAVRIVDENESRELNRRYRQRDKATNVLAFPADVSGLPKSQVRPLGDLVICGPLVEKEAKDQGKSPAGHWGHLLVHGMLHLMGYVHRSSGQAAEMEAVEKRILADRGYGDPYRVG
ncbi:MAG: rRNA maturation RNase YbeY [Woeseia sp.]